MIFMLGALIMGAGLGMILSPEDSRVKATVSVSLSALALLITSSVGIFLGNLPIGLLGIAFSLVLFFQVYRRLRPKTAPR